MAEQGIDAAGSDEAESRAARGSGMAADGAADNDSGEDSESEEPARDAASQPGARRRRRRPIPATTFEEALTLGQAIQQYAAGQRVRRLTLFDQLGRDPDSAASRNLVTSSNQYGITSGSYKAETLELTEDGSLATDETIPNGTRMFARFRLAILRNEWFRHLYENFLDNRLPASSVLRDKILEKGIDEEFANECVETFVVNAKFVGLLRPVAGAERLLTVEHVLEDYAEPETTPRSGAGPAVQQESSVSRPSIARTVAAPASPDTEMEGSEYYGICFYISPIGDEDSEQRQHADLFMGSLVEPALDEFGLKLVRADRIAEPGMINGQMIEHIARCRLVIADLSFHNPNVFYELALRHAVRRPIVQIIRQDERVPFDVAQFRTIRIDTSSIYTLVPRLGTYRAEIASQIRMALESSGPSENPLSAFYGQFWNHIPGR